MHSICNEELHAATIQFFVPQKSQKKSIMRIRGPSMNQRSIFFQPASFFHLRTPTDPSSTKSFFIPVQLPKGWVGGNVFFFFAGVKGSREIGISGSKSCFSGFGWRNWQFFWAFFQLLFLVPSSPLVANSFFFTTSQIFQPLNWNSSCCQATFWYGSRWNFWTQCSENFWDAAKNGEKMGLGVFLSKMAQKPYTFFLEMVNNDENGVFEWCVFFLAALPPVFPPTGFRHRPGWVGGTFLSPAVLNRSLASITHTA